MEDLVRFFQSVHSGTLLFHSSTRMLGCLQPLLYPFLPFFQVWVSASSMSLILYGPDFLPVISSPGLESGFPLPVPWAFPMLVSITEDYSIRWAYPQVYWRTHCVEFCRSWMKMRQPTNRGTCNYPCTGQAAVTTILALSYLSSPGNFFECLRRSLDHFS